jgi:N-terminal acetyltransferase B complex non-catalytic subunit
MNFCNVVTDLMQAEYHEPQSMQQTHVQQIAIVANEAHDLLEAAKDQLTDAERSYALLHSHLGRTITVRLQQSLPTGKAESDKAKFDDALQQVQRWLSDRAKQCSDPGTEDNVIVIGGTPIAPTWRYLHSAFSVLESLQSIALFLAAQPKASKTKSKSKGSLSIAADQQKSLLDSIAQIEKGIHDSAQTLKSNLNASGVLGQLTDTVFGRGAENERDLHAVFGKELEQLPDAETVVEQFCGELRESWEDALDGILSIRVKRYK